MRTPSPEQIALWIGRGREGHEPTERERELAVDLLRLSGYTKRAAKRAIHKRERGGTLQGRLST